MQEDWMSIAEAAEKCGVVRQAVFNAVKKGHIAFKEMCFEVKKTSKKTKNIYVQKRFIKCINVKDLENYRKNKYVSYKRMFKGEKIHDISEHKFSVLMASKWFAEVFAIHLSPNMLYYLIRQGEIPVKKVGKSLVIEGKDLYEFYLKEYSHCTTQYEFIE